MFVILINLNTYKHFRIRLVAQLYFILMYKQGQILDCKNESEKKAVNTIYTKIILYFNLILFFCSLHRSTTKERLETQIST